jgi:hypothetical protein
MQIKKAYEKSFTKKILDLLFADDFSMPLADSFFGGLLKGIKSSYLSEYLIYSGIILIWYEIFLANYVPFLGSQLLVPVILSIALLFSDKSKLVIKKYHFWYLGVLTALALSGALAAIAGLSPIMLLFGWSLFAIFFVALLAGQIIARARLVLFMIWASLPMSLYAIWQFFTTTPTPSTWVSTLEHGAVRATGFFAGPNILGGVSALVALIGIGYFLQTKKYLNLVPTLAEILALGLSFSRESWLGFLLGVGVLFFFYNKKYLYFSPFLLLALMVRQIRERILVAFNPGLRFDSYLDGRTWAIINGTYLTGKRVIPGWGPGSYGGQIAANYASQVYLAGIQNGYTALYFTDNQFLEIMVQGGLLALALLLGFIIATLTHLWAAFKSKHSIITLSVLGAFLAFWVSGIFANVLEFGAMALPLAILLGAKDEF